MSEAEIQEASNLVDPAYQAVVEKVDNPPPPDPEKRQQTAEVFDRMQALIQGRVLTMPDYGKSVSLTPQKQQEVVEREAKQVEELVGQEDKDRWVKAAERVVTLFVQPVVEEIDLTTTTEKDADELAKRVTEKLILASLGKSVLNRARGGGRGAVDSVMAASVFRVEGPVDDLGREVRLADKLFSLASRNGNLGSKDFSKDDILVLLALTQETAKLTRSQEETGLDHRIKQEAKRRKEDREQQARSHEIATAKAAGKKWPEKKPTQGKKTEATSPMVGVSRRLREAREAPPPAAEAKSDQARPVIEVKAAPEPLSQAEIESSFQQFLKVAESAPEDLRMPYKVTEAEKRIGEIARAFSGEAPISEETKKAMGEELRTLKKEAENRPLRKEIAEAVTRLQARAQEREAQVAEPEPVRRTEEKPKVIPGESLLVRLQRQQKEGERIKASAPGKEMIAEEKAPAAKRERQARAQKLARTALLIQAKGVLRGLIENGVLQLKTPLEEMNDEHILTLAAPILTALKEKFPGFAKKIRQDAISIAVAQTQEALQLRVSA